MNRRLNISKSISLLRKRRPLILNVTNLVAMDFTANALLAIGASPIMAVAPEEMNELVDAAGAVVINMGTPDKFWLAAAKKAWRRAEKKRRPVVFDPVGAGATQFRTRMARKLVEVHPAAVVRGNASEILSLIADEHTAKGVEARATSESVVAKLKEEKNKKPSTFVISGATDFIFSSRNTYRVANGSAEMARVTAMGCVASALIAAFCAVEESPPRAALIGMAVSGICGELAAAKTKGPGSFRTSVLDFLGRSDLNYEKFLRVSEA